MAYWYSGALFCRNFYSSLALQLFMMRSRYMADLVPTLGTLATNPQ
jgi:hypothetical protein